MAARPGPGDQASISVFTPQPLLSAPTLPVPLVGTANLRAARPDTAGDSVADSYGRGPQEEGVGADPEKGLGCRHAPS